MGDSKKYQNCNKDSEIQDKPNMSSVSRRNLIRSSVAGAVGLATSASVISRRKGEIKSFVDTGKADVDTSKFDPTSYLTSFDYGVSSVLPSGQTQREYNITATDQEGVAELIWYCGFAIS